MTFALGQTLPAVTGNEAVSGTVSASQLISTVATGTAPLKVTSTTQVANLNASLLGGLAATAFQPVGNYATLGANTFTGNQVINGILTLAGAGTLNLTGNGNLNLAGSINSALTLQGNLSDPNNGNEGANVIGGWIHNAVTNGAVGATIAGGGGVYSIDNFPNTVSADWGTVSGGFGNTATGFVATVAGGGFNTASGSYAAVAGGDGNTASGESSIAAGFNNTAGGDYSFAAGQNATTSNAGAFLWCQGGNPCTDEGTNSFVIAANGPISFYTGPGGAGCKLAAGSGSWACSSDRNLKDNIRSINPLSVLETLVRMPISQWSMKADAAGHKHIGPMAQDFYAAFGLGDTDKYIAQGDAQGVALASIQGLYQMVQDKLEQKDEEIQALKAQLRALDRRITQISGDILNVAGEPVLNREGSR